MQVQNARGTGAACHADDLSSFHRNQSRLRAQGYIRGDRGQVAVVGVISRAADVVLDPHGVALARGTVAASLAVCRGNYRECPPAAEIVDPAVDEINPA